MRFPRISTFFCAVLIILLFVSWRAQASETCDRVVAVVNNDIITLYELNTKMKEISGIDAADLKKKDEQQFFLARWKVLDMLIDNRLAEAKARELGIKVTPDEVDKAIERLKKREPRSYL